MSDASVPAGRALSKKAMLQTILYALVALLLLFFGGSFFLPSTKDQTVTRVLPYDAEKIYAALWAAEKQPDWRSDLAKVELVPQSKALKSWVEYPKQGSYSISFHLTESVPNQFMKMEFTGSSGFSGYWTGTLKQEQGNTLLTSTEHVQVSSLLGRWFLIFMPIEQSMTSYLQDLEVYLTRTK